MQTCLLILSSLCLVLFMLSSVILIISGYYYLAPEDKSLVDRMVNTDNIKINWKEMESVIEHVDRMKDLGKGDHPGWKSVPMIHKVTKTNLKSKEMVIALFIVAFL